MNSKRSNDSEKGRERRRNPRHSTRAFIQAELGGRQFRLRNLSRTGAFIRTPNPMAVGQQAELSLVGERLAEAIKLTAVVRRSERGVGMGVEFTRVERSDQKRLEELVTKIAVARVLVIDEEEVCNLLSTLLEEERCEVLTATSGLEGLYMAVTSQPDLIIMDLKLPELSGLQVCQQLQATPSLAKIPVLVVSATANLHEVESAQRMGAVMFAPKPFNVSSLLNNIRMFLEG